MSFPELIIVLAIFSALFGITTINLLNTREKTSFTSSLTLLTSDIKQQQTKAMSLSVEGQAVTTSDYGVHFETTTYTLFRGSSYSAADTTNFVIKLADNVAFSAVTLPSRTVIFSRQSGEVSGFSAGQNTVTIKNSQNNQQKTIHINRYGLITQVN